ncbi:unnamed protein product [Amoebophrya sp. A120]|nr:unnamed protein product [Amoebophrya sp. A120]|eukprot:GSA120T00017917001.1
MSSPEDEEANAAEQQAPAVPDAEDGEGATPAARKTLHGRKSSVMDGSPELPKVVEKGQLMIAALYGRLNEYSIDGIPLKEQGAGANASGSEGTAGADGEEEEEVLWQNWLDELNSVEWGIAQCLRVESFLMTKGGLLNVLEAQRFVTESQQLASLRSEIGIEQDEISNLLIGMTKVTKAFFNQFRITLMQRLGSLNEVLHRFEPSGDRWIDFQEFSGILKQHVFPLEDHKLGFLPPELEQDALQNFFQLFGGHRNIMDTGLRVDKLASALSNVSEAQMLYFRNAVLQDYNSFRQSFDEMHDELRHGNSVVEYIPREKLIEEYVRIQRRAYERSNAGGGHSLVFDQALLSRFEAEAKRFYDYIAAFGMYQEPLPQGVDGITFDSFLTAMSTAAPSIDIGHFRRRLLVRFGNWKNAFAGMQAKKKGGEDAEVEEWELFEQFGSKLDFNRQDALNFFEMMDLDGNRSLSYEEFGERMTDSGMAFGFEEFAIRLWNARPEAGMTMQQVFGKTSLDPNTHIMKADFAADLFGVYLSPEIQERFAKKSFLSQRKNQIPCMPKLGKKEVIALYDELYQQGGKVTIASVLSQAIGTHVSDVLCTSQQTFSPGETATIAYRIPKKLVGDLQKMPFISVVVAGVTWTQAGGGGWQLRGQNIGELSKTKVHLPNFPRQLNGIVTLQVPFPPDPTERYEFRLFASQNGSIYGKQVGGAVNFAISGPRPGRPIASSIRPTDLSLSWTPISEEEQKMFGPVVEYVIKVAPDLETVEESTRLSKEKFSLGRRWNAVKGADEEVCVYDIANLHPGVKYKFNVLPRHKIAIAAGGVHVDEGEEGGEKEPTSKFQIIDGNQSLESVSYQAPVCLAPSEPGAPEFVSCTAEEAVIRFKKPEHENRAAIYDYVAEYLVGTKQDMEVISRKTELTSLMGEKARLSRQLSVNVKKQASELEKGWRSVKVHWKLNSTGDVETIIRPVPEAWLVPPHMKKKFIIMRFSAVNQAGRSPFSVPAVPVKCPYSSSVPEVRWAIDKFQAGFSVPRLGRADLAVDFPVVTDWGGQTRSSCYDIELSLCVEATGKEPSALSKAAQKTVARLMSPEEAEERRLAEEERQRILAEERKLAEERRLAEEEARRKAEEEKAEKAAAERAAAAEAEAAGGGAAAAGEAAAPAEEIKAEAAAVEEPPPAPPAADEEAAAPATEAPDPIVEGEHNMAEVTFEDGVSARESFSFDARETEAFPTVPDASDEESLLPLAMEEHKILLDAQVFNLEVYESPSAPGRVSSTISLESVIEKAWETGALQAFAPSRELREMPLRITGRLRGSNQYGTGEWTDEFVAASFTLDDVLNPICRLKQFYEAGVAEQKRVEEEEARQKLEAAKAEAASKPPAPMLDENGNPVVDENGNPVMVVSMPMVDENGNPVLDENGNPVMETKKTTPVLGADGKPLVGEDGLPVVQVEVPVVDPVTGKPVIDPKTGKPKTQLQAPPSEQAAQAAKQAAAELGGKMETVEVPILDPKTGKPMVGADGKPLTEKKQVVTMEVPVIDPATGQPVVDPVTGKPKMMTQQVDPAEAVQQAAASGGRGSVSGFGAGGGGGASGGGGPAGARGSVSGGAGSRGGAAGAAAGGVVEVEVPVMDPKTGKPAVDPKTGKPVTRKQSVPAASVGSHGGAAGGAGGGVAGGGSQVITQTQIIDGKEVVVVVGGGGMGGPEGYGSGSVGGGLAGVGGVGPGGPGNMDAAQRMQELVKLIGNTRKFFQLLAKYQDIPDNIHEQLDDNMTDEKLKAIETKKKEAEDLWQTVYEKFGFVKKADVEVILKNLQKYKPGDKKWNEFADELGRFGSKWKWSLELVDHKSFRSGHPDADKLATMYTVLSKVGAKEIDALVTEVLPGFGNFLDCERALRMLKSAKVVANKYFPPETPAALVRGEDFVSLLAGEEGVSAFTVLQKLSACDAEPRQVAKIRTTMEKQGEINAEKKRKQKEAEKTAREQEEEAKKHAPPSAPTGIGGGARPSSAGRPSSSSSSGQKARGRGRGGQQQKQEEEEPLPTVLTAELIEDLGLFAEDSTAPPKTEEPPPAGDDAGEAGAGGKESTRFEVSYANRFDKVLDMLNYLLDDFAKLDRVLDYAWAVERIWKDSDAQQSPSVTELAEALFLVQTVSTTTLNKFTRSAKDLVDELPQIGFLLTVFVSLLQAFEPKQLESLSVIINQLGGYDKMMAMTKDLGSLKMRLRRGQEFPHFVRCVTDFFGGSGNIIVGMEILQQRDRKGYKSFDFVELCTLMQHLAPRAQDLPALTDLIEDLVRWEHGKNGELMTLKQVPAAGRTSNELKRRQFQSSGILESMKIARERAEQGINTLDQSSSKGTTRKRLGEVASVGGSSAASLEDLEDQDGETFLCSRGAWPAEKEGAVRTLMNLMKSSECNLEKLARVLTIMGECGGADESLEIFELTQPLMRARDHMPKTAEDRNAFPACMRAIAGDDSAIGSFTKMAGWIQRVHPVHWQNMFSVSEEILLQTTCGNLRELSDLHFGFYHKHIGDLHNAFQGRSENFKNCLTILHQCGIVGKRNFKYACNVPENHETLLGDSRREYSPVRSRLDRQLSASPGRDEAASMTAAWRAKSREAEQELPPGSVATMFGREAWEDVGETTPTKTRANRNRSPLWSTPSPTKLNQPLGELPPGFDADTLADDTWRDWFKLIKKVKQFRGAAFFLKCVEGCDMTEFLLAVDALKMAQVISSADDATGTGGQAKDITVPQKANQTKTEKKFYEKFGSLAPDVKPPPFASEVAVMSSGKTLLPPRDAEDIAALSTEAHRTLGAKAFYKFSPLKAFLKVLLENGGLDVFLWLVRGVDLTKVQTQLFSMSLLRASPMFAQVLDDEKHRGQLVRLVHACEEVGSIEKAVAKLESSRIGGADGFGGGSGSQNTSSLTSGGDGSKSEGGTQKLNEKFALEAGRIVCRGLNLTYYDARDEQTVFALVDFWRSVFFNSRQPWEQQSRSTSGVATINSPHSSQQLLEESTTSTARLLGATSSTVALVDPNSAINPVIEDDESDDDTEKRIPLEELDLLKTFLVSLREYMQIQVFQGENLEQLANWTKFMKKVDDVRFLPKLEKLLEWPGRTLRQGLEVWLGFRTRFNVAKLEEWRTLCDRMGSFCDVRTKDLSVIMHILAVHAHAAMSRSPDRGKRVNMIGPNMLAIGGGGAAGGSSSSSQISFLHHQNINQQHLSQSTQLPAHPTRNSSPTTSSKNTTQQSWNTTSMASTAGAIPSTTHPPGAQSQSQQQYLATTSGSDHFDSLMFSSVAESSIEHPRNKKVLPGVDEPTYHRHAADLYDLFPNYDRKKAHSASLSSSSNNFHRAKQKDRDFIDGTHNKSGASSTTGTMVSGAAGPSGGASTGAGGPAGSYNAEFHPGTELAAGPSTSSQFQHGSMPAVHGVLKQQAGAAARNNRQRGTRPAKKQAWPPNSYDTSTSLSPTKQSRSHMSSYMSTTSRLHGGDSLMESSTRSLNNLPPPPSLFATTVHAGQILSPLEAEQLSKIRKAAPPTSASSNDADSDRVRNIILM